MSTKSIRKPPFSTKAKLEWASDEAQLIAMDIAMLAEIIANNRKTK